MFPFSFCNGGISAQTKPQESQPWKEWISSVFFTQPSQDVDKDDVKMIKDYFNHFDRLSKAEKWEEIISRGLVALEAAQRSRLQDDEAKIIAQLTSVSFYQGNYEQTLQFAKRCHELGENFDDPSLFIKAVYSESSIYRVLAPKEETEEKRQQSYRSAVEIAQKAVDLYSKKGVSNLNLKGKIYFNLGAAHADNPLGDFEEAMRCYLIALDSFKKTHAVNDVMRTSVRLGRAYLLQNQYEQCQSILDEVRPFISNERLAMHADFLEAELKLAIQDYDGSVNMAQMALERAKALGAKEDELRIRTHLEKIEKARSSK